MREVSLRSIFQPSSTISIEEETLSPRPELSGSCCDSLPCQQKCSIAGTIRPGCNRFLFQFKVSSCGPFYVAGRCFLERVEIVDRQKNTGNTVRHIYQRHNVYVYILRTCIRIRIALGKKLVCSIFAPNPLQTQASEQTLSGRLLFLPRQSIFPQSWQALRQNVRPPFPLQSWEPHLQQCRVRFCEGSRIATSDVFSPYPNGLLSPF